MKPAALVQAALPALFVGLACLASARAEELRDPTRPPQVSAASAPTTGPAQSQPVRLEAVFVAGDRAVAIVDGKLLHVGDWVRDARITAISNDAVHLTRAGRSLTLRLANQAMNVRRTTPSKDQQ